MHVLKKLTRRATEGFEQDSRFWGLSLREALMIAAIPIIIMMGMVAIVLVPNLFVWITAEDSVMEWLQFLLIFASSLIFARLSLRLFQSHQARIGTLCLMIALGTFFVAGEEIAWGQHIFGWSTPQALKAVNVQQETTLHNISSAHPFFVYGMMFAGLLGTLMTLLGSVWWNKRQQSALSRLLFPPLCLVPAFFMPFAYRFSRLELGVDDLFPQWIFPITKFSEVTELCLYFGLVVFAWLNLRQLRAVQPVPVKRLIPESDVHP